MKAQHGDRLVVFSDLDGSLLDHDTYSFDPARPALDQLGEDDIPLVLVTSKTRAEVASLRLQLDNQHPFIVENGAATIVPAGYFSSDDHQDEVLMNSRHDRRYVLAALKQLRSNNAFQFRGFSELGVDGIAALTGLSPQQSAAANDRLASEPVSWDDSDERFNDFAKQLAGFDLGCVRGGRFVQVAGRFDKAGAMQALLRRYEKIWPGGRVWCLAIGDAPNDLGMLNTADMGVVIKASHGLPMPVDSEASIVRTTQPGPEGWCEAVTAILEQWRNNTGE